MRFRLRLFLISEFILVSPRPLLACPKRVIFQFSMFPRATCRDSVSIDGFLLTPLIF